MSILDNFIMRLKPHKFDGHEFAGHGPNLIKVYAQQLNLVLRRRRHIQWSGFDGA